MLFLVYVLLLAISGIALLVMASVRSGQTNARRLWTAVFGAGLTIYGVYLLLFFPGGHYLIFYYVFILPITLIVQFFRGRVTVGSRRQAGAFQDHSPGHGVPQPGHGLPQPGYGVPQPGYGQLQPRYARLQPRYELAQPRYQLLEPGYTQPSRAYRRRPRRPRRR